MFRVGHGIDVHRFADERPLLLGGVRISETGGLEGHSDADAVLHAITDAILGAIGAGDIGEHFPSSDSRWKDADSKLFIKEAVRMVRDRKGTFENVDVTIIAEKPRLAPHRNAIRESIADLLAIPSGRVNVKATTTDGLGFTGRGEGLCAMANASIQFGGGGEI